ncbi:hypothetical protein [Massilia oculi]|uniref:hypothetical protein n=1 Tax=Massilia oculi TaxID=945844 RepID=UPI001AAE41F7|nr:hypothetical protein [Massilia oculi]
MTKIDDTEICTLIRERLEHVELVFELRHHYNNLELIQDVGENGWTHPWRYFDALMYYLLLTCFDLLGQPADWVPFSTWLESRKKADERNAAVQTIPERVDALAIAKHLNTAYQSIYGVKNSFHHFVQHVLTDEERKELYFNIQIVRGQKGGDPNTSYPALGYVESEKAKLDWLFSLRNKFTHNAVTMGNPGAGIFPQAYDAITIDGKPRKGYLEIYRESKNDEWIIYQVRDWPFVLQRLIQSALARREHNREIR